MPLFIVVFGMAASVVAGVRASGSSLTLSYIIVRHLFDVIF